MEVKCLQSVRRLFALLLCAVMMLSLVPVGVWADTDDTEQTTQTEEGAPATETEAEAGAETEATDPTEEIKTLISTYAASAESGVLLSTADGKTVGPVTTDTYNDVYEPVKEGTNYKVATNGRYVIVNYDKTYAMSYESVAKNPGTYNDPVSLRKVPSNPVNTTDKEIFYTATASNVEKVYMDQSNRDRAIWILRYDNKAGTVPAPKFGGETVYRNVELLKGVGPTYDANGKVSALGGGAYWYALNGQDNNTPITQYRYMNIQYRLRTSNDTMQNTPVSTNGQYVMERFVEKAGDETFLIYYKASDNEYRFLKCESNGDWIVQIYKNNDNSYPPVSQVEADLQKLKVRLYQYRNLYDEKNPTNQIKNIEFTGDTTYNVKLGTTQEQLLSCIQENISLLDTTRRSVAIPCSGTTPKVGYYYLRFDVQSFGSGAPGKYTLSVRYRNDVVEGEAPTDTVLTTLTVNVIPPKFTGAGTYYVERNTSKDDLIGDILESITVANGDWTVHYSATPTAGSYWLEFDSEFDSSGTGDNDYFVKVNYRQSNGDDYTVKTLRVVIDDEEITSSTPPTVKSGIIMRNVGPGAVVQDENGISLTFTVNGDNRRYVAVGMLTKDGKLIDTSIPGVYEGLTLTYNGTVICTDFTLEVVANDTALDYPGKGEPGYVGVDKDTTTTPDDFSKTGVANIQLSATGIPKNKGLDLIFILDLSGSMRYKPNTNTYVDEDEYDQTRIVAMQKALLSLVETMRTSGADIRVAMSDFGDQDHFYFKDAVVDSTIRTTPNFDSDFNNAYTSDEETEFFNFRNMVIKQKKIGSTWVVDENARPFVIINRKFNMANPTYTGIVVPTVYTGSHEVGADAFVPVSALTEETMKGIVATIDENAKKQCGTNYDIGLEYAYHLGYSIQEQNIAEGTDRDIVCIFMSDGAPMQYNYFTGASQSTAWADWITGEADGITTTVYASEPRYPGELNDISEELLKLLQAGKLVRPDYHRDGAEVVNGTAYFQYRDRYNIEGDNGDLPFFDYMDAQGYDLDWDYLCDIARANGIENFSYEYYRQNPNLPELRELYLTKTNGRVEDGHTTNIYRTKLINPYYSVAQFYETPPATLTWADDIPFTTQFIEALESIGVDFTWQLFTEIAEKNRKNLKDSTTDEYAALKKLITRLKTPTEGNEYGTHSPYTYFYNEEGKNWWAEAIKGDPDKTYHVINKYAFEDDTNRPYTYNGEAGKQNNYNSGQNLPQDGKDYISGFRGLGMDIYTVSFSVCDDRNITVNHANQVMLNLASGPSYFYTADSQESLTNAMKAIVSSASTAATQAWYTDTMGEKYDLSTKTTVQNEKGEYVTVNKTPTIKVLEYALDASGNRVEPAIVRETVHFNCAPSSVLENDTHNTGVLKAWSDQVYTTTVDDDKNIIKTYTDIWGTDGLISGKYFHYNTNTDKSVTLPLSNSNNATFDLDPETFFWLIGTIGQTEIVLEYQVYLTGSIEGTIDIPSGTKQLYDTNKSATLHYVNLYGNPCTQDPPSPKQPWGDGVVLTEDTVVIDFGIPVKVDVLYNDYVTDGSTLGGVKAGSTKPADGNTTTSFKTTATGSFGSASIDGNKIKYTPSSMEMQKEDIFTYAVKDKLSGKYYYSTLTVIPATTIYYEDNFAGITYETYDKDDNLVTNVWTLAGTNIEKFQGQDIPNFTDLEVDANNIYGFDSAYSAMTQYSMGSARYATVTADRYATAEFDFWGTGFDVISACDKATGTLMVSVYNKSEFDAALGKTTAKKMQDPDLKPVAIQMVDTYYGYSYDASTGKWTPITDKEAMPDSTYQIPVVKVEGLNYGNYTAVITASYAPFFDHNSTDVGYQIYIDAIRIYDPANDGEDKKVVQDAYVADGEGWPTYYELRNIILDAETFDALGENDTINGAVFIDGKSALSGEAAISDYTNFGPNNEVYLAKEQGICFKLPSDSNIAGVHIAMKKIYSSSTAASVKIYNVEDDVNAVKPISVGTATDLYYNISALRHKMIMIYNDSDQLVSITNIKITHIQKPEVVKQIKISKRGAAMALASLESALPDIQEPEVTPTAPATVVNKWNIVLGDDIGANFYVEAPKANATMAAVKVTVAGHTEIYDLSDLTPDAAGLYKIPVNVAAAQMTEDITLQMVVDGEAYTAVSYTVQDYAKTILAGDYSAATKNLVAHMLNYGASAQSYFGVNKDNLANAGNEIAYTAQYPAEYPQLAVTGKISGVRFYGASLVFESKVAVRYYFEAESVKGVTFTVDGINYPTVEKNGKFYVEVPGIAPSAYADSVVLSVQKDGQQLQVSYSPLTYMVRMSQKGQPELQALMNAMYGYYEAAIAYEQQAN